jgi:geranylgeranylglyceryl phosphate synthase family protein
LFLIRILSTLTIENNPVHLPSQLPIMPARVYNLFLEAARQGRKLFVVLMDPDTYSQEATIDRFVILLNRSKPDLLFVGGSLTHESTARLIRQLRKRCTIPTVLFPGNVLQFTPEADALLFLSLISGRNPDFLIGQHVQIAPVVKQSGIETISTGYILVQSDTATAVEYISNTRPIPRHKPQLAAATAIAGELLGNRLIYLEAGSGATPPVPPEMVTKVKASIEIPLIVGGGLRTEDDILRVLEAGADAVVVGNILETFPEKMVEFAEIIRSYPAC